MKEYEGTSAAKRVGESDMGPPVKGEQGPDLECMGTRDGRGGARMKIRGAGRGGAGPKVKIRGAGQKNA